MIFFFQAVQRQPVHPNPGAEHLDPVHRPGRAHLARRSARRSHELTGSCLHRELGSLAVDTLGQEAFDPDTSWRRSGRRSGRPGNRAQCQRARGEVTGSPASPGPVSRALEILSLRRHLWVPAAGRDRDYGLHHVQLHHGTGDYRQG